MGDVVKFPGADPTIYLPSQKLNHAVAECLRVYGSECTLDLLRLLLVEVLHCQKVVRADDTGRPCDVGSHE